MRTLLAFILFCFSSTLSMNAIAQQWPLLPEQAAKIVDNNLATGVFYYHYLNEDYQSAANQLRRLRANTPHGAKDEIDILEVTLLLALGIEQQAELIFNRLESNNNASARAWLFMARRWLAHGHWEKADASAMHSLRYAHGLSDDEYQETLYILTLSAIEQEQLQRAKNQFSRMHERGYWADLARFNLLVAHIESYAAVHAIEKLLTETHYYQEDTAESQALADRSNLLGGLYMLEHGHSHKAARYFSAIKLTSPYSPEALLFYGWALLEQSDYYAALQPWRALQHSYADWHPAVIESLLAVPHTMEMMNANTQALHGYELVEERITTMLANIHNMQNSQRLHLWLEQWLAQQQGDWGWRRQQLNIESDEVSQSLMGLVSVTAFRNQLAEYYDLQQIQQQLQQLLQQLELWQQMLKHRQQSLEQTQGAERLARLQQQQQDLLAQVDALEKRWRTQEIELFSYASSTQRRQLQQLDAVVDHIKLLQQVNKPSRSLDSYKERWRRNRGLMLWEMTYDQSARQWSATREFWQLDAVLADMRIKLKHSRLALEWSADSWQGLGEQVTNMQARISALQGRVQQLQQQQQQSLVAQMSEHLEGFATRLLSYQSQARLATARLYDDALQLQLAAKLAQQAQAEVAND